jgi:serine/threonine protein kinase
VLNDEPYGHSVDWWALGVMVYKMTTGSLPFDYDDGEDGNNDTDDDGVNYGKLRKLFDKIIHSEPEYPDDMPLDTMSLVMMVSVITIKMPLSVVFT